MKQIIGAALAALLIAAPAHAATKWQAEPDPQTITWFGTAGSSPLAGACTAFDADITFDAADLNHAAIKVTIDMAKCQTGEARKDEYLPQEIWFNSAKYPTATFESKKITHLEGDKYLAIAAFTIKGITADIELPFTLTIEGDKAHVVGETSLSRMVYRVGDGPELMANQVASIDIAVKINLRATRQ
tara:strand:- start:147 stop:707 length:561 start_codon:yes stop_codon:yes gene_type:complete